MLTDRELTILSEAKDANPWYFEALVRAASIMAPRRKKYSGEGDPYTNFIIVNGILRKAVPGFDMAATFLVYIAIKVARLLVSRDEDFEDEKAEDTLFDLANYSLLMGGYFIRERSKE